MCTNILSGYGRGKVTKVLKYFEWRSLSLIFCILRGFPIMPLHGLPATWGLMIIWIISQKLFWATCIIFVIFCRNIYSYCLFCTTNIRNNDCRWKPANIFSHRDSKLIPAFPLPSHWAFLCNWTIVLSDGLKSPRKWPLRK